MQKTDPKKMTLVLFLEKCLYTIEEWMGANRLKMNNSKTECMQIGSKRQQAKCTTTNINVNGETIKKKECLKYLGAQVDTTLSFKKHITCKAHAASINLHRIKQIRDCLTLDACKTVTQALVTSHLDYANSLLHGLPKCEIKKLQRVQTRAAKMVLQRKKYDSATECLKDLHWLPIKFRIEHKILTLVFKTIKGEVPDYLKKPSLRGTKKSLLFKIK